MAAARVTVEGLSALRRRLRQLELDTDDLKDANAAVAQLIAAEATSRAPRRTGRLAATVRGNRAVGRAQVKAGGASTPYAGPIHYGWPAHHLAAQPFISDAAEQTEGTWLPLYEDDLARIVDNLP